MRKIAILSLCLVLLLAVCAYSAAADVYMASAFNKDNPTFGGSSQESSNPNADDDEDQEIHVTGSVTIANNGTSSVTITSIGVTPKVTSTGQTFTLDEINITLVAPVEIQAGGSAAVALSARIPEDLDAVNKDLREAAFNVADITLKNSAGGTVVSFSAYMQRENNLVFKKVYVKVGERSDSVDDDDKVDEVKPGDEVEVEATIENDFNDNDDVEIEDVEFAVLIDDHDLDVDEDDDIGDIGPEEDETEFLSFDVDDDVDDDVYLMEITIEGEDENGARHGERINIDFEVEKNRHEIKISSMSVVPSTVDCGDSITAKVEIANIGRSDEDETTVRVMNEDLEIDTLKSNIDLDEGDSTIVTFDITIPENISVGEKAFTVITYYDYNEESLRGVFTVNVEACEVPDADGADGDDGGADTGSQDTTSQTTSTSGITTATTTSDTTGGPVTTVSTSDKGFRESPLYMVLLILAIVIVVGAAAAIVTKLVIARK